MLLHVTILSRSRLIRLLIFSHPGNIIVVCIILFVFVPHFLKVLGLNISVNHFIGFGYESTLFDPFFYIKLSLSLKPLIDLLLSKLYGL